MLTHSERTIRVAPGRTLVATPVFDTYWKFAAARQRLFMRRVAGEKPPWTDDPVIASHRFTNTYRASDRVSQFLIRHVQYSEHWNLDDDFFRTLLFKIFNKIETWEYLERTLGEIRWRSFSFEKYASALDKLASSSATLYSGAYIMPSPNFGDRKKHRNHLHLLEHMMRDGAPKKVARCGSLAEVFSTICSYPSLGNFLAFQFAIDLNYSRAINFSEMDFVVAGPGARDGIRKCFSSTSGLTNEEIIQAVTDMAADEFRRLHLTFPQLWGRPLQLIDCQNIFCEVDKYARVVHPEFSGISGRTRIKQRFAAKSLALPQWYPPKWNLALPEDLVVPRKRAS